MVLRNLKKSYNGRCVLELDELSLEKGKIYAVIGANGSGKSTLAKLAAGVLGHDGGRTEKPDLSIGYMPQKSFAFRMSLRKNMLINGDDAQRAQELLGALKLGHLSEAKAKRLSGGETARMALARLLMRDYELLVLDEPSSAMDIESTLLAERLIRDYRDRTGCAVLIVTHSINQAERVADEVLFLSEGRLIERGSPEKLIKHSENEITRRFIEFYSK